MKRQRSVTHAGVYHGRNKAFGVLRKWRVYRTIVLYIPNQFGAVEKTARAVSKLLIRGGIKRM